MRLEDILYLIPLGLTVGSHVTPSDHMYFEPKDRNAGRTRYDVVAPADGAITLIQHRTSMQGTLAEGPAKHDEYRVVIELSGTFYCYFDLITQLDKTIDDQARAMLPERGGFRGRIPVKAGQLIGKIGGQTLDFGVVNTESKLKGLLVPEHYDREPWKIHTVDPFDYFDEPLRGQLLKLNVRKTPPYGGKIDYDVDGKLAGNWFLEGSNGYGGNGDPRGYWMGHLSFVYHHVHPTNVVVSMGDFGGQMRQFWVKENSPDPAAIGTESGAVKYELVWGRLGSNGQSQVRHDADQVQGVLLVQVLPGRQLKFEAFPGKTAAGVRGFTSAARIYER